ncbi:MAG: dienelactone hydrolase family protein [Alphaproteobacteria bacterium]|nr:dienelactone hydrolase family protein [Alphaproteobacteria bacterium]
MLRRFRAAIAAGLILLAPAAPAADIAGQKMTLPARERTVDVTYFRARSDAPRPSVLLLHGANGFDSQIANYNRYAAALADAGFDAYLVFYYSPGDWQRLTRGDDVFARRFLAWTGLVSDLAADIRKRPDTSGKIGLVGFSNGGTLSGGTAALDPAISAAVIYYGAVPFPLETPVTRLPPLLILHGDADAIIPIEQGRRLAELARSLGGKPELVVYPGERHGFGSRLDSDNGADALSRTIAFLKRELN